MNNPVFDWYASLNLGGMLVAPTKIGHYFGNDAPDIDDYLATRLRRNITAVLDGNTDKVTHLLEVIFEQILEFNYENGGYWLKQKNVLSSYSQKLLSDDALTPDRIWLGQHNSLLPIFIARKGNFGIKDDNWTEKRLGVGRGKVVYSRVLEWMRKSGTPLAVLTNGKQIRLIHAGLDYDAWAEWDIEFFFQEGVLATQLVALKQLLGRSALERPSPDAQCILLQAVQASRQGQAELSSVLGERLRRAVELMVRASDEQTLEQLANDPTITNKDIYIAACRMVMRCIVVLFAESRELLPRDNEIYNRSYSLQGLREQLELDAGGRAERLRNRYSAWPRVLALFRLMHDGSAHNALPIMAYGGDLFKPGDMQSTDPVQRALAAFEQHNNALTDATVHQILQFLTRSKIKVRVGNRNMMVDAPVDFSALSTEYIGIIYEGLLDYELYRAEEPMVFLNVGDEPVLPFDRLDNMTEEALAELFSELATGSKATLGDADEDLGEEALDAAHDDVEENTPDDASAATDDSDDLEEADDSDGTDDSDTAEPLANEYRERVFEWAKRAVVAAGIVQPPRNATEPEEWTHDFVRKQEKAARALVPPSRLFMPGRWYLARWGGTRKGSGTFYTRPQLAVPTTHRTLEPLLYDTKTLEIDGDTSTYKIPKKPEEILALKVCDPAMGSGSFLVAALRYMTDALYDSLVYHKGLKADGERTLIRMADGNLLSDSQEDPVPLPRDHEDFESQLKVRLKRYIVERCIYGVDYDPLAVELSRMALWIETMNPQLPFGFIDHKIKCGNSLVGAWFDRVQDYPALAFERSGWDGGDKSHNGVHFKKDQIGKRFKTFRDERIKPELRIMIESSVQQSMSADMEIQPAEVHEHARKVFEQLAQLPLHEASARAQMYRQEIVFNPAFQQTRKLFDIWCAIWFWPFDALDHVPSPATWTHLSDESGAVLQSLQAKYRFFHWELEFPDAFNDARRGFDTIIGNPPWEISKPNSKEYFSNIDPLYRSYGKQEALKRQREYFGDSAIERDWLDYNAQFKALSNFFKNTAHPFGDGKDTLGGKGESLNLMKSGGQWRDSDRLHRLWQDMRKARKGYADAEHPFQHQGSADVNTYKLFLEMAHALLQTDGNLGFIVPSGIYTDNGTSALRELFLDRCRWQWLFGFENRNKVFDIDSRFKFCPIIIQKGGKTEKIRAVFMHRELADWENAEKHALDYPADRILQFSPKSKSILELRSDRDLEILQKIYDNGVLLGDDSENGWGIKYATEFHMTNDSHLFPPRPEWEARGYQPDEYGHWIKGPWRPVSDFGFDPTTHRLDPQHNHWSILDRPIGLVLSRDGQMAMDVREAEDVALPLYEGRMIGQFDFSQKGWVRGKGRTAEWRDIPWENKIIEPQYLMGVSAYSESSALKGLKAAFLGIGSATNSRSMTSSVLINVPCGNAVPVLQSRTAQGNEYFIVSALNSYAYDFVLRCRLGGINLNYFVIEETPLLFPDASKILVINFLASRVNLNHIVFAREWITKLSSARSWKRYWASSPYEHLRLKSIIDTINAYFLDLSIIDLSYVLQSVDHPLSVLKSDKFTRRLPPKGFWRVDKDKDPELRHTVLTQVAFQDLQNLIDHYNGDRDRAIAVFCGMASPEQIGDPEALTHSTHHIDPTEGWMVPETLRLADYGLGHDDRAKAHQPVASRLGPRFYDWQLTQDVDESWEECRRHAELLEMIVPSGGGGDDEGSDGKTTNAAQKMESPQQVLV